MTWTNNQVCWSWDGNGDATPPSVKTLDYVTIKRHQTQFKLCIGVWDDDIYTPLHRAELERYLIEI